MCTNGWSQKFPCTAPPVHSEHPQDLKEAEASEGCGQNIALVPNSNHRHWSNQHKDICKAKRTMPANKSGPITCFLIPSGCAANFPGQIVKLPENAFSCQLNRSLHLLHSRHRAQNPRGRLIICAQIHALDLRHWLSQLRDAQKQCWQKNNPKLICPQEHHFESRLIGQQIRNSVLMVHLVLFFFWLSFPIKISKPVLFSVSARSANMLISRGSLKCKWLCFLFSVCFSLFPPYIQKREVLPRRGFKHSLSIHSLNGVHIVFPAKNSGTGWVSDSFTFNHSQNKFVPVTTNRLY